MRPRNRSLITCLLGLVTLAALSACGLAVDPVLAPRTADPTPIVADAEPWTPSEEWLELYQRDQEVRDLLAQSLAEESRDAQLDLYDDYREAKNSLQDYLVENPDADAPCPTLAPFAPPEMWCTADDLQLEANFNLT